MGFYVTALSHAKTDEIKTMIRNPSAPVTFAVKALANVTATLLYNVYFTLLFLLDFSIFFM